MEKQLPGWIMKYTKCLSYPSSLQFYATHITNFSANHGKVERHSAKGWYPYKGDCFSIVESLLWRGR